MEYSEKNISSLLRELNEIGIALSAEKDHARLLELILVKAMEITNADGGTLYSRTEDNHLKFETLHNRSLKVHKGGTSGEEISFPPLSLFDDEGKPNNHMVAACAAISGETVNIPDAYASEEFDFSGTRNFDSKMGYRSTSFLTVPMTNHENDIIGVLQLINAIDPKTEKVISFSGIGQQVVESLASQAAVTITNKTLIDAQKDLFDAFIQLIADAIDEKSPYTAGHCRRVPVLTNMLAVAANKIKIGPLKDFSLTADEIYELDVAAWLHDCGKITTPEYVVDKGTKLETIFDRINLVDMSFEILKRDAVIESLKSKLRNADTSADIDQELENDTELQDELMTLVKEREDIRRYNVGGESISDEDTKRIEEIAERTYVDPEGETVNLLAKEEIQNLQIGRGTLSVREREIINNHVSVTIKMLESLPYPKHLTRVPEFAGGHHEKMDGTGYPNKLTKLQMSVQARMIAIADVFEALTASDRPYKKAMSLSQSLTILGQMKLDNHIDADLFDIFMNDKIYLEYANKYLGEKQIDDIDLENIPGYIAL
ncbi:MAG TPA: GAF domain-containing protein [Thiotrichaceae bacterium]|jgi:HD-GYP domain-containing protein (c-di-GMP phosphodiesterase class II)|nr:GAF domain-containing protein [Thiotrichaceae bacterium]HIM09153.1 GAF domain-containing protein [Gammaproteobacteria bacterium]